MLDWTYKKDRARWEEDLRRSSADGDNHVITKEDELTFPLEKARLKWAIAYTASVAAVGVGYGWTLDKKTTLALPLIFLFLGESSGSPLHVL